MIGLTGAKSLNDENILNIDFFKEESFKENYINKNSHKEENLKFNAYSLNFIQKKSIEVFDDNLTVCLIGELYNENTYEENFLSYIKDIYYCNPDNFLGKLNGTFVLLVHDKKAQKTIIAVDKVASKPLFYSSFNGQLFFSSNLSNFSNISHREYSINLSAIADILSHGFILNNNTFFNEIQELKNGNCIVIHDNKFKIIEYWNFNFQQPAKELSKKEYANRLKELLHKSVKRRIRPNVSSGILLSGGVDSRAILYYYKKYVNKPITVCYGFDRDKWELSDGDIAKKLAEENNCKHYEIKYNLANYSNTIQKVTKLSNSFARVLPEFEVYKKIREEVKVHRVFSGDNNFGRFGKFMGNDEQMMEIANYINYFEKYGKKQFPISEKLYDKLSKASKQNINNLLEKNSLKKIHDRKDFFFLNSYMISLIGKDRMTISNELEVINPWYDSELLDFIKTLPTKYRMDKVLFKQVVDEELKNEIQVQLARTVTKPNQSEWNKWNEKNLEEVKNSLSHLKDLQLLDADKLSKLFTVSKNKKAKPKTLFSKINNNLPLRNRYNWVNTKAPEFVYNCLVSLTESISNINNKLIFKGYRKKKQKQVNKQSLIVSLVRLNAILEQFNCKPLNFNDK